MLSTLRRTDGQPTLGVRLLAALVILGMAGVAAPFLLMPVLRWFMDLLF